MSFTQKTVGRRTMRERVSAEEAHDWQRIVAEGYSANEVLCDRGVYRFASFEEAQAWMLKQRVAHHLASPPRETSRTSRRR